MRAESCRLERLLWLGGLPPPARLLLPPLTPLMLPLPLPLLALLESCLAGWYRTLKGRHSVAGPCHGAAVCRSTADGAAVVTAAKTMRLHSQHKNCGKQCSPRFSM